MPTASSRWICINGLYGALALPRATSDGHALIVFKQPGVDGRNDVLIVDKPSELDVRGDIIGEMSDGQRGRPGRTRLRVTMRQIPNDAGALPASVAVLRVAAQLPCGVPLGNRIRTSLASVRYTVRAGDRAGWFEYAPDAVSHLEFAHGFPDIATREQGPAGIRGPSHLVVGLQRGIATTLLRPRSRSHRTAQRAIYELHVGTFTQDGHFAAAASRLAYLRRLGFTTIQLMPIDVTSGVPGWSYDQTRTGAVDAEAYGGAAGLIAFVERAHALGLEVIIDKQYNHRGPEQDSRGELIEGMFTRATKWGPGLSGKEAPCYSQIVKLIGEELAYWALHFGADGFRLDATNRMPWELHEDVARLGAELATETGKSLYLLSEYAEAEEPFGRRVPTGRQYADQPGRLLMKLLQLSTATHVTSLVSDAGSLLRPMLKAARRGWWYPDVPPLAGGLNGDERSTTLLWNHDWIGNRFGGERVAHLVSFALFKTLAVWQMLGQWTPLIFMGTERYVLTPWYFFTGHRDQDTRNNTSVYYEETSDGPLLTGGRFHEFMPEARDAGLRAALAFSRNGTASGIDWEAFRNQTDGRGHAYMDHARRETFEASKLDWERDGAEPRAAQALFAKLLHLRRDPRITEGDPRHTQYKAWAGQERAFVLRRRSSDRELIALINMGDEPISFRIKHGGIDAHACGPSYIVAMEDAAQEDEWAAGGRYSARLDTNSVDYGGRGGWRLRFEVTATRFRDVVVGPASALVFSRGPGRR